MALHFVGFKKDHERILYATRFFGEPDFVHHSWDYRAYQEFAVGDTMVFAQGCITDVPKYQSFDDSEHV